MAMADLPGGSFNAAMIAASGQPAAAIMLGCPLQPLKTQRMALDQDLPG